MGIMVSPQHGLNPGLEQCFFCLEDIGVLFFGRLEGDKVAPKRICKGPESCCEKCASYMEQGVILISVREPTSEEERKNPYRTGGFVVLKDESIQRVLTGDVVDHILKARFAFLPDEVWDMLGLPKEGKGN